MLKSSKGYSCVTITVTDVLQQLIAQQAACLCFVYIYHTAAATEEQDRCKQS